MESNICYFCERPNGKRRRTDISGDAGCGLLRRQKEGMRQQKMQKKIHDRKVLKKRQFHSEKIRKFFGNSIV